MALKRVKDRPRIVNSPGMFLGTGERRDYEQERQSSTMICFFLEASLTTSHRSGLQETWSYTSSLESNHEINDLINPLTSFLLSLPPIPKGLAMFIKGR